jgi:hypothetical protein
MRRVIVRHSKRKSAHMICSKISFLWSMDRLTMASANAKRRVPAQFFEEMNSMDVF